MNYNKIYDMLIDKAKNRKLIEGYFEKHHIKPKSLGGSDDACNIIRLTAREHYIAHLLLVKIYPKSIAMVKAAMLMCVYSGTNDYRMNNRVYSWLRERFSTRMSINQTGCGNTQFGTVWVTDFKNRKSYKVKKNELSFILENDNIKQGRVVKFDKYDDMGILKKRDKIEKVWVSNVENRISKKILKIELSYYLSIGFINKKIQNFDKYRLNKKDEKDEKHVMRKNNNRIKAETYFNKFMNGDYNTLLDFVKLEFNKSDISSIRYLWLTHIPGFKEFLVEKKQNNITSKLIKNHWMNGRAA